MITCLTYTLTGESTGMPTGLVPDDRIKAFFFDLMHLFWLANYIKHYVCDMHSLSTNLLMAALISFVV